MSFKPVDVDAAAFILELRTDAALSKYLSSTNVDLKSQQEWILSYKQREAEGTEAYFIALDATGERVGLNRLYNFDANSFEAGSWLYKRNLDMSVPILGDLAARDYGFETLNFSFCRFEVRKENKSVINYHLGFKPEKIGEDDLNFYFKIDYTAYKIRRDKLLKILHYGQS